MINLALLRPLRLPAYVAIAAAVILVFAGVAIAYYQEHLFSLQQRREVEEQAGILAASVSAALVFNDNAATQEYLDALRVNPELDAMAVYDANGRRVAAFSRKAVNPFTADSTQLKSGYSDGYLDIAVPVFQNGARVGTVALRATTQPLERRFFRYFGLILLVTMGALVMLVQASSQSVLNRANAELESRAKDLLATNQRLQIEIEERQKIGEALRQSQKMEAIGQLSGGVAHDFNNLLTIVRGNLQLLRRRLTEGSGNYFRYIDSAEEALTRGANLTQRILAFSRQQPLSPTPVQLNELVIGMGELLRHSAGERIEITRKLGAAWWLLCDANQMENVILNLVINARDAMPDGGSVSIETYDLIVPSSDQSKPAGEYVELIVRDTGTGMSDEVREKAVDPFFTTKLHGQGTGLGLSMTFGFVRQSNGHFEIESAIGKGTAIRIAMPRHIPSVEAGES